MFRLQRVSFLVRSPSLLPATALPPLCRTPVVLAELVKAPLSLPVHGTRYADNSQ